MKIPYSFIQKCNDLSIDISTCTLTAYHAFSLHQQDIYFDTALTLKLKNPIKLNAVELQNINIKATPYRLLLKDPKNNELVDDLNVLGVSDGQVTSIGFDTIKDSAGAVQFQASNINKSLMFASSGAISLSFDQSLNKITISGGSASYVAGSGIRIDTNTISIGNVPLGGISIGAGAGLNSSVLVPGVEYSVLTVNNSGIPYWGSINLSSNAAVSGILPVVKGGTGLSVLGSLGSAILSYSAGNSGFLMWNGSAFSVNTNTYLTSNQTITLSGDVTGSGTTSILVSVNKILGNTIPLNATGVLFNDGSGLLSWVPISGGGGTVTSVGLSTPSLFTVSGSPVVTSGVLSFAWNGSSTSFVLANGTTTLRSNYLLSSSLFGVSGQVAVFNSSNSVASSSDLRYEFNKLDVGGGIVIRNILSSPSLQFHDSTGIGYDLYHYGAGLNLNEYDTSGSIIATVLSSARGATGQVTIGGIASKPVAISSLVTSAVVKSNSGGVLLNVSGPSSNIVLVDGSTIPQNTFITGGPYLPISGGTETGTVTFASGTTSLAPISFQSGSLLTTPVAHHVEWNGSNLYITNSTPTRKQIAYTDSTMTGLWNGTVISPVYGGTGFSTYSIGDILYANTTSSLAKLAATSTGNVLLSGTSPSWGKVGLATHISGVLPIANGGTGISSLGTLGTAILQYSSPTSGFVKWSGTSYTIDANSYLTSNQTITLSGDVVGSGVTAISTSILSTVVTGKVLTGYSTGINSTITSTDSILGAFGKVQGQINSISTSLGGGPFLPLTAGATKALSGTLYGIGINLTSTTDSPILITHNLAGGFTHPLQAFNSGMVTGNQYNFDFGQAASNYNSANFGFKYVASGSSANYVTLGLYGVNDLLKITGAGAATFSGLGTGVVVGTSGTLSTLTGTNLVRGDGTLTSFVDNGPWLPLSGGVITGPITGTTTTATPFIHITSTFGNLTNAAIRATSTASGGASIHGIATGTSGVGVWGTSSNTGGDAGLFSGQGGSNGVRAIASGGGKAGLFQGDVLVSGELKISTSLTGLLKATAGVVTSATAGDIPALPYIPINGQISGTVDFNSINSGARTLMSVFASSGVSNAPPGWSSGGGQGALWQDYGANYVDWATQLVVNAQPSGGALQFRTRQPAATWMPWHTVWHDGNLTNLSQLVNGPGYVTGGPYVPTSALSGLSGVITDTSAGFGTTQYALITTLPAAGNAGSGDTFYFTLTGGGWNGANHSIVRGILRSRDGSATTLGSYYHTVEGTNNSNVKIVAFASPSGVGVYLACSGSYVTYGLQAWVSATWNNTTITSIGAFSSSLPAGISCFDSYLTPPRQYNNFGDLSVPGMFSASGSVLRYMPGYGTDYVTLYSTHAAAGAASTNNFALSIKYDAQVTYLNGKARSGFLVNGVETAYATSGTFTVNGLASATNHQNSTADIGSTYTITTTSPQNLRISTNTTITIPPANAAYAGMSWHVSCVYSSTPGTYYSLDVTGIYFKNNQANIPTSTHPYWGHGNSLGSPLLAASTTSGLFAFARIYCNGTAWFVEMG